ncbi:conjugal transfer protein TrbL family protein [Anaeromicropila populeti]|uniref:Uncharacterized protein n=1 Tax=Anaeromicropila populeti TaxID=37658 RepID=A0A1I6JF93_9FIRM|nr:conjugal transfer protein TrbL family protein [Anaeromicropila populeti]SFR77612.1 hypothetical protein SAMN05661086_01632 [Anaeromicropila populeti]
MDLKDIFIDGLKGVLSDLMNDALGEFDSVLGDIVSIALKAETYMKSNMGMSFDEFYAVMYLFGIYLIILKFLKKGFNTYVLWVDGDPDMEPLTMCISFFKAMVIAISFATLFDVGVNIAEDMIDRLLNSLNNANVTIDAKLAPSAVIGLTKGGLFMVIMAAVYLILYIMLWIQFIKRGLELFVLKAGMPIACAGLMDSDGGVFKVYVKKIVQELLTVLVQILFLKFSLVFMLNKHVMFGIAAISFATKAPQFLSEFIMMSSGGGGGMGKISQASMIIRNFRK